MKMTQDDIKKSDSDYAAAFNEDHQAPPEKSENAHFGIEESPAEEAHETPAAEAAEAPAAAVVVVDDTADAGNPGGQTADEAKGDGEAVMSGNDTVPRNGGEDGGVPTDLAKPGEAAVEAKAPVEVQAAATGADGAPKDGGKGPMTEQQLKSWEGRLRKAQADLDAAAKTGKPMANGTGDEDGDTPAGAPDSPQIDALEQVADKAEGTNPDMAKKADELADKVEDGSMTFEEAMKVLTGDFGPDFVNMIVVIAKKIASETGASAAESKVGEVGGAVKDIIAHINDSQAKAHYGSIQAKHPDFADVGQSQGFKDWVEAHATPDEMKRIASGGSADEINKMLDEYKASQAEASTDAAPGESDQQASAAAADPVVQHQMDAAEGVRSAGMSLPSKPAASSGYEDAWKEFA